MAGTPRHQPPLVSLTVSVNNELTKAIHQAFIAGWMMGRDAERTKGEEPDSNLAFYKWWRGQ